MVRRLPLAVALVLALGAARVQAQDNTQDFTDWLNQRTRMAIGPVVGASTPGKQVETPSIADSSMAIVDTASAPDLIGIATQFFNLGKGSEGTPASVTLSAFTLRTALLGLDPSRPEVYAAGRHWRRFSVSVGRESADEESGAGGAQVIGVKVLAWDGRDPTRPENVRVLQAAVRGQDVAEAMQLVIDEVGLRVASRVLNKSRAAVTDDELQTILEERLDAERHAKTLEILEDEDLAAIDALLVERLVPALRRQQDTAISGIEELKRAPQLALSYQGKLRDEETGGADEHAWQVIVDYALANRVSLTFNGAMSRVNTPFLETQTGGRLGLEAQFQLTGGESTLADLLRTSSPLMLTASYQGVWGESDEDAHKFQTKLTIPLPSLLKGLSLPISLTVASDPDLIDETDVRGQVGFTIDFSKFQQALRTVAR